MSRSRLFQETILSLPYLQELDISSGDPAGCETDAKPSTIGCTNYQFRRRARRLCDQRKRKEVPGRNLHTSPRFGFTHGVTLKETARHRYHYVQSSLCPERGAIFCSIYCQPRTAGEEGWAEKGILQTRKFSLFLSVLCPHYITTKRTEGIKRRNNALSVENSERGRNGGRVECSRNRSASWAILSRRSGCSYAAYRVSRRGHLYICRRATRGRSAVGDMFTGHDLLPTSATVNLGVTTSASASVAQGRQPHTRTQPTSFHAGLRDPFLFIEPEINLVSIIFQLHFLKFIFLIILAVPPRLICPVII